MMPKMMPRGAREKLARGSVISGEAVECCEMFDVNLEQNNVAQAGSEVCVLILDF